MCTKYKKDVQESRFSPAYEQTNPAHTEELRHGGSPPYFMWPFLKDNYEQLSVTWHCSQASIWVFFYCFLLLFGHFQWFSKVLGKARNPGRQNKAGWPPFWNYSVISTSYVDELKGNIFMCTIYPWRFVAIALFLSESGSGVLYAPSPPHTVIFKELF